MLQYKGREIPETFAEIVDPKHTALIVHEMLNDFLNPNGEFAKTIPDNGLGQVPARAGRANAEPATGRLGRRG